MPETETPTEPSAEPSVDPTFAGLMDALVELMRSGVRPDVLEAQRVLLQRLAQQGDVFPARIPPPLNITEVGGYLNLLERAGQSDIRSSAIASALGVAGPPTNSEALSGAVPVGFVSVANDRPEGPAQASIPPLLVVRADFHAPLQMAKAELHAAGVQLPLRAPRTVLPASQPAATASSLDHDLVLSALGRQMEVFPGTVLVDATVDALAIARLETPADDPLRLVGRVLDGTMTVAEESWIALRASESAVVEDAPALRQYVDIAPVLSAAGWNHPTPTALPTSLTSSGSMVQFVNTTGLVTGETTLGDELALLYTTAAIARSAFSSATERVWDGSVFVE
jgi:hypothetical protein